MGDRIFNVVTSIPYLAIGIHTFRRRETQVGKLYGASLLGVGAASMAFHATSDHCKAICRKLDYWSIALSSILVMRAVNPGLPPAVSYGCAALVPFQPFAVTFANTSHMEVDFCRAAVRHKALRRPHLLHSAAGVAGLGCFYMEEADPEAPYVHGCWHVLSAVSLAT